MKEPDPWGCIIYSLWAAHLAEVEEARETSAVPPSGEFPLSPQLYSWEHSREHSPCPNDGESFARGTRT